MKTKNLMILVLAAVVLGGLAHLSSTHRNKKGSPANTGKSIFPVLQQDDALKSIDRIVVRSFDKTITFARVNNIWVAPERYNYPADFSKVGDFVRKVIDLKIGQAVTGGQDQLKTFQLVSPDSGQTNNTEHIGTLVRFEDKAGKPVISMVVGKERMTKPSGPTPAGRPGGYPDGRYLLSRGKVVLVGEGFHDLPGKPQDWLDSSLLNVPAADILNIAITSADKQSVTLNKPAQGGTFLVQELSPEEELDTSKINTVAGILNYLTFDDVADPDLTDKDTGLDKATVYVARTSKGQVYTLRMGKSPEGNENRYVRLQASYEPPPEKETSDEDKAENDETAQEEQKELTAATRDLNEKIGKWTYLVRPYGLDSVSADSKDYIKKKEDAATEERPPEPAAEKKEKKGFLKKLMPWRE
jgi:hypothetical protein